MIMEYLDSHQILLVIPNIHPLNNAPSNWSSVDLDTPYIHGALQVGLG